MQHQILTSANGPLKVTTLRVPSETLSGMPLGTADGSATAEIGAKVIVIAQSGGSTTTTAATGVQGTKTVAATGTPAALVATSTLVESVILEGKKARDTNNATVVYWGFTSGNDTQLKSLTPGDAISISSPSGKKIDLAGIFIDVTTAADGITYTSLV